MGSLGHVPCDGKPATCIVLTSGLVLICISYMYNVVMVLLKVGKKWEFPVAQAKQGMMWGTVEESRYYRNSSLKESK